mgnify:FL=1
MKTTRSGISGFCFVLLILIFITGEIKGQTTSGDSLMQLIAQQEGLEKVKNLFALTRVGAVNDTLINNFILNEIKLLPEAKPNCDSTLDLLHEISTWYFKNDLTRYSQPIAHKGLNFAIKTGNINYQVLNHLLLSQNYFIEHLIDKSNYHITMASRLAEQYDLDKYKGSILNTKANNAAHLGFSFEALNLYQQTAELLKAENNLNQLAIVHENIGLLQMNLGNNKSAIPDLLEAIRLIEEFGSKQSLPDIYVNLGVCYLESDSLHKASEYYHKAIQLARGFNMEFQVARAMMNLANLERRFQNYGDAKAYLDTSLTLCRKYNIDIGIVFNKINLGDLYLETGIYDKALNELEEAERLAAGFTIPDQLAELYRLKSQVFEKLNKETDALKYYKKYFSIKDSLAMAERSLHASEMESRLEAENSLREFSRLKEDMRKSKTRTTLLIIGLLLILTAFIAMTVVFNLRRKTALLKSKLAEEEKETLKLKVELRDKELTTKAIYLSKMNEVSINLGERMKELLPGLTKTKSTHLQEIIHDIEKDIPQNLWKEFETRFGQVHAGFYKNLQNACPALTPTEVRICSFLRLNLSTKEIAALTNRSAGTIDNARSSIRKKLNLVNDSNLTSFLLKL